MLSPQHKMIPYPLPDATSSDTNELGSIAESALGGKRRGSGHNKFPLDVALTPFHLAMVFYDRVRIICTVSIDAVQEVFRVLHRPGNIKGLIGVHALNLGVIKSHLDNELMERQVVGL